MRVYRNIYKYKHNCICLKFSLTYCSTLFMQTIWDVLFWGYLLIFRTHIGQPWVIFSSSSLPTLIDDQGRGEWRGGTHCCSREKGGEFYTDLSVQSEYEFKQRERERERCSVWCSIYSITCIMCNKKCMVKRRKYSYISNCFKKSLFT